MNKVLVSLYVPTIEAELDIWLPLNKKIYTVINLLLKVVFEFSGGYYRPKEMPLLYDKQTAKPYDVNLNVRDSDIKNGTEIILI